MVLLKTGPKTLAFSQMWKREAILQCVFPSPFYNSRTLKCITVTYIGNCRQYILKYSKQYSTQGKLGVMPVLWYAGMDKLVTSLSESLGTCVKCWIYWDKPKKFLSRRKIRSKIHKSLQFCYCSNEKCIISLRAPMFTLSTSPYLEKKTWKTNVRKKSHKV